MVPFTICICTHNRAPHLRRCLQSLVDHMPEGMTVPVMVVDNASTDDTSAVAEEFMGSLDLVCQFAPDPGLSRARNVGWRACRTEYIVYLDDDARATPQWIPAIARGLDSYQPDYFGGPYVPFYLDEKPDWFLDKYGSMYLDRREGVLSPGELL
ncbi:MAG: glycosyltransferase family 2 protein, partial [Candidatus Sumerlaeia bacterium]|nr:glycosyltransferase family 2 protein [Candidatus Sumerlaeia bacterium]